MKRKIALFLALVMLAVVGVTALPAMAEGEEPSEADKAAAAKVAALIDAIYVQQRTETTDADCAAAKAAWDALTDAQKELVEGEFADPDYFGRDTGDASKDDPRNADGIGENELLVVSFGTSFNDSRAGRRTSAASRRLLKRRSRSGPCAGPSPRRSSSITSRPGTGSSSTTWTRPWSGP